MTELLRVNRIGKSYGGVTVLQDLSLSIRQGEIICLLGETRAGKTTLLRCLNLLERIDRGSIEYGGYPVIEGAPAETEHSPVHVNGTSNGNGAVNGNGQANGIGRASGNGHAIGNGHVNGNGHANGNGIASTDAGEHADRAPATKIGRRDRHACRLHVDECHYRRKFGVVASTDGLFPHRTVLENVIEGPVHVLREPKEEASARARELLNAVGMSAHTDARPSRLTLVQRRLVALARAIAMKPEVLLIDEITAEMGPRPVAALLQVVKDLRACHNAAVLMVTHQLEFASEIADRICFLDQGRIVERGEPRRVLSTPRTARFKAYIDSVRASR